MSVLLTSARTLTVSYAASTFFRTSGSSPWASMLGYCSFRLNSTSGLFSEPVRRDDRARMHCFRLATADKPHSSLNDAIEFWGNTQPRHSVKTFCRQDTHCMYLVPGYKPQMSKRDPILWWKKKEEKKQRVNSSSTLTVSDLYKRKLSCYRNRKWFSVCYLQDFSKHSCH